jgi:hypothetical protein
MLTLCVMLLYRYSEPLPQLEVALRKAYLARGTGKGELSVSVPCGSCLKTGSAVGVFCSLKGIHQNV